MTIARRGHTQRIPALDFTKGALVLLMVLYHWLNYFMGAQYDIYRYLRFLTPSFIFITGFLISNVYLAKYDLAGSRLPKRLVLRGLKVLGIFILLNVTRNALTTAEPLVARNLAATFLSGQVSTTDTGKAASFFVLVPISYLLLVSASFLILSRTCKYVFHIASGVFLMSILVLYLLGLESPNLELLTVGVMGVIVGYIPIDRIDRWVTRPARLVLAYLGYLAAITVWNVRYPLQIVGVCLSVMVIYLLGTEGIMPNRLRGHVILVGKYSLFAYISQIVVLQLLRRSLREVDLDPGVLAATLVAALCVTVITVEALDRARIRASTVNRIYGAVFS